MWEAVSIWLLVAFAIMLFFMWKSDRDCDEVTRQLLLTQEELMEAQEEIVRLDREIAASNAALETVSDLLRERTIERDEAIQSAENIEQRLKTSEEIRLQLAASLSGRANGHQITMGNGDAKIVHGSVVVSDPDTFAKGMSELAKDGLI